MDVAVRVVVDRPRSSVPDTSRCWLEEQRAAQPDRISVRYQPANLVGGCNLEALTPAARAQHCCLWPVSGPAAA